MKLTDISTIKDLFERHGFAFTKSLGQNFLINPNICPKIAELGGAAENVCAIEIGTGVGVLTRELSKRCKKVVAVEIDRKLEPILKETLNGCDNTEVIFADVLKTDLGEIIREKFGGAETIICANLPFYITSPVIMKVLESRLPITSMTVMVQREAAERICAAVGTRESGAVSYAVSYYSDPRMLFKVNRGNFIPAPNVDSAVIRLDIKKSSPLCENEEKILFRLIRAGFSKRRKQLVNPLSEELHISKANAAALLDSIGVKPSSRAEELTLDDFIRLARSVKSSG